MSKNKNKKNNIKKSEKNIETNTEKNIEKNENIDKNNEDASNNLNDNQPVIKDHLAEDNVVEKELEFIKEDTLRNKKEVESNTDESKDGVEKKNKSKVIKIVIVAVVFCLLSGSAYLFYARNSTLSYNQYQHELLDIASKCNTDIYKLDINSKIDSETGDILDADAIKEFYTIKSSCLDEVIALKLENGDDKLFDKLLKHTKEVNLNSKSFIEQNPGINLTDLNSEFENYLSTQSEYANNQELYQSDWASVYDMFEKNGVSLSMFSVIWSF